MAPVFSGTLPPKKKYELQEIAAALRLSDQGTKDEIHTRIKKHLDKNQATLEDDPTFAGLFGRRRRSVQPSSVPPSSRFAPPDATSIKPSSSLGRRVTTLNPVRESTPVSDLRDVSTFLKHPTSPTDSTPHRSPRQFDTTTPSSLPPLPPSPVRSLIEHVPHVSEPNSVVMRRRTQQNDMLQNSRETLIRVQTFLSNSRNIWSLTALGEILYILSSIIPWNTVNLPLSPVVGSKLSVSINYPPWHVFQTYAFWMVLGHWIIPTLIIPAIVGNLVSFKPPGPRTQSTSTSSSPTIQFDPLTASIIRLAAHVGYPFALLEQNGRLQGLDVLGFKWRVLGAAVGVAFAFAEAIAGTPQLFAKTLADERCHERLLDNDLLEESPSLARKALMGPESNMPL